MIHDRLFGHVTKDAEHGAEIAAGVVRQIDDDGFDRCGQTIKNRFEGIRRIDGKALEMNNGDFVVVKKREFGNVVEIAVLGLEQILDRP